MIQRLSRLAAIAILHTHMQIIEYTSTCTHTFILMCYCFSFPQRKTPLTHRSSLASHFSNPIPEAPCMTTKNRIRSVRTGQFNHLIFNIYYRYIYTHTCSQLDQKTHTSYICIEASISTTSTGDETTIYNTLFSFFFFSLNNSTTHDVCQS